MMVKPYGRVLPGRITVLGGGHRIAGCPSWRGGATTQRSGCLLQGDLRGRRTSGSQPGRQEGDGRGSFRRGRGGIVRRGCRVPGPDGVTADGASLQGARRRSVRAGGQELAGTPGGEWHLV